jgi:SagB-type dehydrogenase family enzyme
MFGFVSEIKKRPEDFKNIFIKINSSQITITTNSEDSSINIILIKNNNLRTTLKNITLSIRTLLIALTNQEYSFYEIKQYTDNFSPFEKLTFDFLINKLFSINAFLLLLAKDRNNLLSIRYFCRSTDKSAIYHSINKESKFILSKFAFMRFLDGYLILVEPLANAELLVYNSQLTSSIAILSEPITLSEFVISSGLELEIARQFIEILINFGFTHNYNENSSLENYWAFQDLIFHLYSRRSSFSDQSIFSPRFGATYRFEDSIHYSSEVVKKITNYLDYLDLFSPNIDSLQATDKSFTEIIENRKSIRFSNHTITLQELGEFLYRTARVKTIKDTSHGKLSMRPYPNAGAMYELEIYLAIHSCEGLEKLGFYYYAPVEHRLYRLKTDSEQISLLLETAKKSIGEYATPQILFIVTSRYPRMSRKYESICYSLSLKNLGALIQTMYLVATAMDLSPCSIGSGHANLFNEITNINILEEAQIGEFALNGKKAE